jgi:hypothetical protein
MTSNATAARLIGANPSTTGRDPFDYYATPPIVTEALLKVEPLNTAIWEPCCGEGHMSKVLEAHQYVISTDIQDYGYGRSGVNLLDVQEPMADTVVTNPPFGISAQIVRHLLKIGVKKLCILHKLQFLEGISRVDIIDHAFNTYGAGLARVYPFIDRQSLWKGGKVHTGGMFALAWFVWERGFGGLPTIKRIRGSK